MAPTKSTEGLKPLSRVNRDPGVSRKTNFCFGGEFKLHKKNRLKLGTKKPVKVNGC